VIECPPVRFRRPPGMLPLPVPEHGRSIGALRSLLNLLNRNDLVLVVAKPYWLATDSNPPLVGPRRGGWPSEAGPGRAWLTKSRVIFANG
jgi:hypothetical protein